MKITVLWSIMEVTGNPLYFWRKIMSETFRSKVEEILHDGCRFYEKDGKCAECDADLALILAALKERVEGMPILTLKEIQRLAGDTEDCDCRNVAGWEYQACKSYLLEGLE